MPLSSSSPRPRSALWLAGSLAGLVLGVGVLLSVSLFGLRALALTHHAIQIDARWNADYRDAVVHLHGYGLSGEPAAWEAYGSALSYPRAVRAAFRAAAEFPGDGPRLREAVEAEPLVADRAELWGRLAARYGASPTFLAVARVRAEKDSLLRLIEARASQLAAEVQADGPASPAAQASLDRIRELDRRIQALDEPFRAAVLASAEAAESAVERLLVLTGLLILLGGGGALWVGARRSRRREGKFLRNERQLREIAESVSGVFWIMDRDRSRTLYVSPGYAELWGRPAEELGRDPDAWLEGVHADDRDRVRDAWQDKGTATSEVQFRVVTPAGEVRRVRSRAFPIHDEDGDVVRIMGFVEDITLRQELEHEIVRSQNLKSVGRLAGGVAHEFNNLLTVAQGHLQLLIADHPDEPATVADLEEALKATQRAGELTRDLLSFAGRQLLIPRPLELSSFLRDSMGMVEALLVSPVTLETTIEKNVCVRADPTYLRDVLLSLTQFCVERMPGGGILRIGVEWVTLGEPLRVEGGKLPRGDWGVLFVGDSGGPIPRHLRQRLFEPFGVTLDLPSTSHLGMSAAYGIVEQSGGGIRLDVEGDRGARFIVYMPRIPRLVPEEAAEDARTRPDTDSIAERADRDEPRPPIT